MDQGTAVLKTWYEHELHPLCTLFPRLADDELHKLAGDIREHGLQQPIVLHDGMILDGGNRYRACQIAGVEPTFVQFGGDNLVSFVLSANLHRRHMSTGQQAAIVAAAQDWAKAQTHGGARRGNQAVTLPLETVAQRAAESGASDKTQRMADKVAREAPDLARKVAHGEISLPKAVAQVEGREERREEKKVSKLAPVADDGADDLRARVAELEEQLAEMASIAQSLTEERDSLARVVESSDQLAAAMAEAKRYRELARVLQTRVDGLLSENAEAKRAAKMWKGKFDRLEKARVAA